MINHEECPQPPEDSDLCPNSPDDSLEGSQNKSNFNDKNTKFPDDDSHVGDNPVFPNKEDLIPVNNLDNDVETDSYLIQKEEIEKDQTVGSDNGGVYPYNINSNTSEENDGNKRREPKEGPLGAIRDEDYVTFDSDSYKRNI